MRRATREAVEKDPTYLQISEIFRHHAPCRFNTTQNASLQSTKDLMAFLDQQLPLFPSLQASLRKVAGTLLLEPLVTDWADEIVQSKGLNMNVFALPWILVSVLQISFYKSDDS